MPNTAEMGLIKPVTSVPVVFGINMIVSGMIELELDGKGGRAGIVTKLVETSCLNMS